MHGVFPRGRVMCAGGQFVTRVRRTRPNVNGVSLRPRRAPGTGKWWRRWELNPRPQALRHRIYVRVQPIDLAACYPAGGENTRPAPERFSGAGPEHAGPAIL